MEENFEEILFASPDYDETLSLRFLVLREPLGLEYTSSQIEEEWNQKCFVIRNEMQQIIACLLFEILSSDELKMRQVVVHPKYQSQGIGSLLVKKSESWARKNNYKFISLHARNPAVPFYLKLNYKIQGGEFVEVGIPHFVMIREL
ncbi:MAG: GNAT family N-acetyltransferase [Saprospiraceae bacterium]